MTYEISGIASTVKVDAIARNSMAQSHLKVVQTENTSASPSIITKSIVEEAVRKLNEFLSLSSQTVQITIDQDTEKVIVKVIDAETQKVLRQIPNEEVLDIAKNFDNMKGMIVRLSA